MTRLRAATAGLVLTLICVGCSDDGDSGDDGSSSEGASTSASASESSESSESPSESPTDDSDDDSDSPSEPPEGGATGPEVEGSAYTFRAPEGWVSGESGAVQVDSAAASPERVNGFSENVTVIESPADLGDPTAAEQQARKELQATGAKDITVFDRVTVAGEESPHIGASVSFNDKSYRTDQFILTHDDTSYVVTFSFTADRTKKQRDDVAGATLLTWTWTD